MRSISHICFLILAAIVGIANLSTPPIENHPSGILINRQPIQHEIHDMKPWKKNDYLIRPLASFEISARTLLATHYSWDREADISPLDLTLGWGPMSDSAVLSQLNIRQGHRKYLWQTKSLPISPEQINRHAANMHLVPANTFIENKLLKIIPGNLVTLKGYLIQAAQADGWSWTSSLTRDDSGHGACEVFWVDKVEAAYHGR